MSNKHDKPEDDPLVWMLTMEFARQRGDFARAEAAKRQLERLGVRVIYRPRQRMRKVVPHGR